MYETMLQKMFDARVPAGLGVTFYGVYVAQVTEIIDPDGQGKIKVRLPWSPDGSDGEYQTWARLATMMAGNNRGTWFVPDVDDEVLIAFSAGDVRHPFVIGSLWNGQDQPPEAMDSAGDNHIKTIRSRNGVRISFNDEDGRESLTLETPGGQKMELKDGPGGVTVEDSNGNSVKLGPEGITVSASAVVKVEASMVTVSASAMSVDCPFTTYSGVVQADTVITNSVISASYTPGAGNIW